MIYEVWRVDAATSESDAEQRKQVQAQSATEAAKTYVDRYVSAGAAVVAVHLPQFRRVAEFEVKRSYTARARGTYSHK